jgi:hypothetical protein
MRRRYRGWRTLAAGAVVGLTTWLLVACDNPKASVSAIMPIGQGDRAIALLTTDGARDSVALLGDRGTPQWVFRLPGKLSPSPDPGVTAAGDTITVAYRAEGGTEPTELGIVALDVRDGSEVWRTPPVTALSLELAVSDEETMFWSSWDGATRMLHAVDRLAGTPLWSREIPKTTWLEPLSGALVRATATRATEVLSRADGDVTHRIVGDEGDPGYLATCVADGRLWAVGTLDREDLDVPPDSGVSDEEEELVLLQEVAITAGAVTARTRPLRWERDSPARVGPGVCGLYGDLLVFAGFDADGHFIALADPDRAEVVGEIPLGPWAVRMPANPDDQFFRVAPHAGSLPRHLWIAVDAAQDHPEPLAAGLVLVDLEERRVAHRAPPIDGKVTTFHRDGITYVNLWSKQAGGVAAFVGDELVGAVGGEGRLRPDQVRGAYAWMAGDGELRLSRQRLAILKVPALEPVAVRGGWDPADAKADARELLGL